MSNLKHRLLLSPRTIFFYIDASGNQNLEPKERTIKFSTLFPNEYSKPNLYYTKEMTKASTVKNIATEFEMNHLTDVNVIIMLSR